MKVSLADLRKLIREAVEEVMATEGVEEKVEEVVGGVSAPGLRRGVVGSPRELSREMPKFSLPREADPVMAAFEAIAAGRGTEEDMAIVRAATRAAQAVLREMRSPKKAKKA